VTAVRIVPLIFARLDSQRLPGKVVRPLLGGKSIIEELLVQLNRIASKVPGVANPVIATTSRVDDKPLVSLAHRKGVDVISGEILPLQRLQGVAAADSEAWLWRVNADSPLLLQALIARAAAELSDVGEHVQLITNLVERSFPYGVSLEMYRASMIAGINLAEATDEELEHITPVMQRLPPASIKAITAENLGLSNFNSAVRLTVDNEDDAVFFRSLWSDPYFQKTCPGSLERLDYAYRKRIADAT